MQILGSIRKGGWGGLRMFGESRQAFFCCCVMPYVGSFSKNACARVIIKFKVIFRVQGQINHLKDLIGLCVCHTEGQRVYCFGPVTSSM